MYRAVQPTLANLLDATMAAIKGCRVERLLCSPRRTIRSLEVHIILHDYNDYCSIRNPWRIRKEAEVRHLVSNSLPVSKKWLQVSR
jgi:hypothetical protein